ncbi:MAG: ThuA domain-containing protein [Planctomycetes bacterium]|nr:ThuA domain-containing protein [Planctomycetota bacterium]
MRMLSALPLLLLAGCGAAPPAAPELPARVLILTGEDAHHDWPATTPVLKALLEENPRLQVEVLEDLRAVATTDLSPYAAVIVHFKNEDPAVPGRAAFERLDRYVRGGGGLVLVHFGCGAFQEFRDDFEALVGRVWFGDPPPVGRRHHDPYGPFRVEPVTASHPVTAGLQPFSTTDELYTCLVGSATIEVLAEAHSKLDGDRYPMALVRRPGAGRVFLSTLGHDVAAYQAEGARELYRRGVAWTAGLLPAP